MDRLTSIDAAFLAQERAGSHMHIGSVMRFGGSPPDRDDLVEHIASRLHLVPRYRQKLVFPRMELGRPLWTDDPNFNITYHVRHTALPSPGSDADLRRLAARVFSQRLDRSKPLWEMWLVEGLEDGGWALLNKTHHCLVDGISGVDITAVLMDLDAEPADVGPATDDWAPGPPPSTATIAAQGLVDLVRAPTELAGRAIAALRNPGHALAEVQEAAEGIGEILWGYINTPPANPLNVQIGPHRRVAWIRTDLEELKEIKNGLGGTLNDAFLATVSGALRRWLQRRGMRTEGVELRGCVPVSVRRPDERGALGNRITMMACPLPVYAGDPRTRFRIVSESMAGLKESKQALGAEVIAGVQDFAPPTIFAEASRLNFSTRIYNLLVTNVPGPQFPLYMLGREMTWMAPVPFLALDKALAVAIFSYNGQATIGLMGDYDALDDLDTLEEMFREEIAELREAAGEAAPVAAPAT